MSVPHEFQTLHNFRAVRKNGESKNLVFRSARQEKLSLEETKVNKEEARIYGHKSAIVSAHLLAHVL